MLARQCFSSSSQRCLSWESHTKACEVSTCKTRAKETEHEFQSSVTVDWHWLAQPRGPLHEAAVPTSLGDLTKMKFSALQKPTAATMPISLVSLGVSRTTCNPICHTQEPVTPGGRRLKHWTAPGDDHHSGWKHWNHRAPLVHFLTRLRPSDICVQGRSTPAGLLAGVFLFTVCCPVYCWEKLIRGRASGARAESNSLAAVAERRSLTEQHSITPSSLHIDLAHTVAWLAAQRLMGLKYPSAQSLAHLIFATAV